MTSEKNWYLASLKPNAGSIAHRNLVRQGFDVFYPLEAHTRRRNVKFEQALRQLFPGYIFVAVAPGTGSWRKINSTQGVGRLVSFGSSPAQVPSDFVTDLQSRCDSQGCLLPSRSFSEGDTVVFRSGPLSDLVATVETLAPDRRVWLLLDFIGGKTRVLADPENLTLAQ